nr:Lrp/AsnC family transcriptional regulator [Nocardioides thalensis]
MVPSAGSAAGPSAGWPALDKIDARLISHLQDDARGTYVQYAEGTGLSAAAVRVRVQRLHETGVVRTLGVVHPEILGIDCSATVGLKVDGGIEDCAGHLAGFAETTFVVVTAGRYDVLADVSCRTNRDLVGVLDRMLALPGVTSVEPFKHLDRVKSATQAPHTELRLNGSLDEIDHVLLRELEQDGRASYAHLAAATGLSQAGTRARVHALLAAGAIRVLAVVDPIALGIGELCGFGLKVGGPARQVAQTVASLPSTELVALTAGRWDVVGTLRAPSDDAAVEAYDQVRQVGGVAAVETFAHLAIRKEAYPRLSDLNLN